MSDYRLTNHGTIVILDPDSKEAKDWCNEHLPENAQRWGADGYVIEPRYVADIVHGMQAEGLVGELRQRGIR